MRHVKWVGLGLAVAGVSFLIFRAKGSKETGMANVFSSKEEFIRRIFRAIGEAAMAMDRPEIGTVQQTILTAQAIHEASWGAARASREGFNYWNLTAGSTWKGPVIVAPDLEYSKDAQPGDKARTIAQSFRKYDSDINAAADMLRFIGPGSRYAEAYKALTDGDAMEYAAKLREKGFYTQPLPLYQEGLRKAIQTVVTTLG